MNENIFDKRRLKTFSNCKDLVKSMVGTRDGVIVYNEKFRLDFENCCYKANMYEVLQQRIDKAIKYIESKEYQYGDLEQDAYDYDIGVFEIEELLEILQGGNNEP